ncbi:MAG: hypothetical protein PHO54_05805 [Candidatus Peribacteraceae bacterium]|nr:hypothetical protein [Candidatus Peribacteraceae bacterium]
MQLQSQHREEESGYTQPSSVSLSKNRSRMRRDITERMGKRWDKIEEDITQRLQTILEKKHYLIRSSPQVLALTEMILAGEKATDCMRFLRLRDPERFAKERISDAALLKQIQRFKENVVVALESDESGNVSTDRLEMYARVMGRHVDIHKMMEKVILYQEWRLNLLLRDEERICEAADKAAKSNDANAQRMWRMRLKAMKTVGKELTLYVDFLMSYGVFKVLSQQSPSYEQQQFMHEGIGYLRKYLP